MKTRLIASAGLGLVVMVFMICGMAKQAVAQGPIGGALATLAAATAQASEEQARQRAIEAAQRATAQAVSIEATRIANQAQATATAQSLQATQAALDEQAQQHAMTATAQWSAVQATSTAETQRAEETHSARQLRATETTVAIQAEATRQADITRTYAERQARFTLGLLLVEIAAIVGAGFVMGRMVVTLWRWARKVEPQPLEIGHAEVKTNVLEPACGRMPDTVTVIDDPELVKKLDEWAEQYDEEREEQNGN